MTNLDQVDSKLKSLEQPARHVTWRARLAVLSPRAICWLMFAAVFFLDAVLPLKALWFHEALLTQMGWWPVLPTLILFPGVHVLPPIPILVSVGEPVVWKSWLEVAPLMLAFMLVFLVYLLALRVLPGKITQRFLLRSTFWLGMFFVLIPVVTSPDVYSYIAYARMGLLYHLNPLTTLPEALRSDVIYTYVAWPDQPSAYGPTWILVTSVFQGLASLVGLSWLLIVVLVPLRLLGLAMHLISVALIWSLSGSLQGERGQVAQRRRMLATLAFAWNPLLLLEACTNAHNDAMLLCLLLLALWCMWHRREWPQVAQMFGMREVRRDAVVSWVLNLAPAVLLAVGICLKVNLVLLAPGLFYYQWRQAVAPAVAVKNAPRFSWKDIWRGRYVPLSIGVCIGLVLALYGPFWQDGELLHVLVVNPATSRTINSLARVFSQLYNGLAAALGAPVAAQIGSPAEEVAHTVSMGVFVFVYLVLCWRMIRRPSGFIALICGMALVWLAYCALGSPWYWPWYSVTFFGLFALLEGVAPMARPLGAPAEKRRFFWLNSAGKRFLQPGYVRWLAFSMLSLYCFTTWGPLHSVVPGLPTVLWASLSGLWAWLLPLLGLYTGGGQHPAILVKTEK